MFVRHDELLWMLRQVYGQRIPREKLVRKFASHGIYSLFPYYPGIAALFESCDDKPAVVEKALRALGERVNRNLVDVDRVAHLTTCADLEHHLLPLLENAIILESSPGLEKGTRVSVRHDTNSRSAKPGSEGFITEKSPGQSRVRFYLIPGRYGVDSFPADIPDEELQVLTTQELVDRHQDIRGVAQYFFYDALLRAMKTHLDASVYTFAAEQAVKYLLDKGFLKIRGAEYAGVLDQIFPALAPEMDRTYQDPSLFSSPTLSSPPSERKAHVLRLELTTGCDYNRCTFCSEYSDKNASTKTLTEFRKHVDKIAESIGSEKARIQRLFIGSGNTLSVPTELLLQALDYASQIFKPQKISLYGRTSSILGKSVAELKTLKEAGLTLVYWGLESGSDAVLDYICKDCSCADMIEAAKKLATAEIDVSAMLMPGVGGTKFSAQHVEGTLELLHSIDIKYLTLLSINPAETSKYAKTMQTETDNRHLTPDEVNAQIYQLLQGLKPTGVQIGMFTEEIDQASSNTKRFNCQFTEANKELLLREFWNASLAV